MPLDELKEYLRIDSADEDMLLSTLVTAAEDFLKNAGVIQDYTNDLYKLAVKLLVSHWYENRQVEQHGRYVAKLSFSLDTIITQLKYCQEQGEVVE